MGFALGPSYEITIAGERGRADTEAFLRGLNGIFGPNVSVILLPGAEHEITQVAPFTQDQGMIGDQATAYLCVGQSCLLPTTDPNALLERLNEIDGN